MASHASFYEIKTTFYKSSDRRSFSALMLNDQGRNVRLYRGGGANFAQISHSPRGYESQGRGLGLPLPKGGDMFLAPLPSRYAFDDDDIFYSFLHNMHTNMYMNFFQSFPFL